MQRPHLSKDEYRYFGKNACLALWKHRPQDVIRVYVHKTLEKDFGEMIRDCAKARKAFHLVEDKDLEKLTDSIHHQGICVVARGKKSLSLDEFFNNTRQENRLPVVFLDGVQNPHNIGAVLRTAAHFGVRYIIGQKDTLPRLSPAANRTSEGGAENVDFVRVDNGVAALQELKKRGFAVYAADIDEKAYSLYETRFPGRSVFVFGHEVHGVSEAMRSNSDFLVRIPGSGEVESLNVSVACALILGENFRQSSTGTRRIVQK